MGSVSTKFCLQDVLSFDELLALNSLPTSGPFSLGSVRAFMPSSDEALSSSDKSGISLSPRIL
ncbi:hypothetical protein ACHAXS_013353 [Conticribra weissflogii]